jgi:hypothetical protein
MFHGPLKGTIFVHLVAAPGIRFGAKFQPCEQFKNAVIVGHDCLKELKRVIEVISSLSSCYEWDDSIHRRNDHQTWPNTLQSYSYIVICVI